MNLLADIQAELLEQRSDLGSILLKLRYLADRLGSDFLEDWVSYEIEGYPQDIEVPDYRKCGIVYSGTFTNGVQTLNNVSIARYLVEEHAGKDWGEYSIREPQSVIDHMIASSKSDNGSSQFGLDTGNLKIMLQDKIYEGFTIVDIHGVFSIGSFIAAHSTVRARILDLTLQLENKIPESQDIGIGPANPIIANDVGISTTEIATQIINYGPVTNISNSGAQAKINVAIAQGSTDDLIRVLSEKGIPEIEAKEFAGIVASEEAESADKPIGKKAAAWIGQKARQGATGAWDIGKSVATDVLKEAVKEYYGLK